MTPSSALQSNGTAEGEQVVALKHHLLVRLSHWLNLAVLIMLTASGFSIYWASPVFKHAPNQKTGSSDYVGDAGAFIARHLPGTPAAAPPRDWIYNHLGLGTFALAGALQIHWMFAYLFMLAGLLYAIGLAAGGGWRALIPRPSDVRQAFEMIRYYAGVVPMWILRRPWPHPHVTSKYNALQRGAYFSMPLLGLLAVASGWAMHKPAQLGWLERCFGSYDGARIVHFLTMLAFLGFVIPHVVLVFADGWDTMRSMITGWSDRLLPQPAMAVSGIATVDRPAMVPGPPRSIPALPADRAEQLTGPAPPVPVTRVPALKMGDSNDVAADGETSPAAAVTAAPASERASSMTNRAVHASEDTLDSGTSDGTLATDGSTPDGHADGDDDELS